MDDSNAVTIYYNRKWVHTHQHPPQGFHPRALSLLEEQLGTVSLEEGQALVKTEYISVDPHSTCQPAGVLYTSQGSGPKATAICRVIAVRDKTGRIETNDLVRGDIPLHLYAVVNSNDVERLRPSPGISATTNFLSAFGPVGQTAYFGFLKEGNPKPGETVVISAAAGGAGHIAVQLARLLHCNVIGIVGNDEKQHYLEAQLQIRKAISRRQHSTSSALEAAIRSAAPEGVDFYFDLVGGAVSDAVFPNMKVGGRIVIAGQTSQYPNIDHPEVAARIFHHVLFKRLQISGFHARFHTTNGPEKIEFERQMDQWLQEGKVRVHEEVVEGFEQYGPAAIKALSGDYIGKVIVKVDYSATVASASPRMHVHREP
eukprot:TRINITY_DN24943_c0_g1_i1.p1 TRINITY_DN24943_c0_g1~~TRINITY_DN24943_c0_g1_i1.p1  ORF type:complete len:378 (-),score=67.51 TRINITY_DN24943_c0_g1_i1:28-1140(-)